MLHPKFFRRSLRRAFLPNPHDYLALLQQTLLLKSLTPRQPQSLFLFSKVYTRYMPESEYLDLRYSDFVTSNYSPFWNPERRCKDGSKNQSNLSINFQHSHLRQNYKTNKVLLSFTQFVISVRWDIAYL